MRDNDTNILNTISLFILFVMICACYFLWTRGIGTQPMLDLYTAMVRYVTYGAIFVLLLNIYRLSIADWFWVILAVASVPFYSLFSDLRGAGFFQNVIPALIIVVVIDFKIVYFNKWIRTLLASILLLILLITMYRIFTEMPPPVDGDSIWAPTNKLKEIWINTNTIGASVMTASLLSACLFKSLRTGWSDWVIYPIYLSGLVGTWVVQSKASFVAMVCFVFLDVFPENIKEKLKYFYAGAYTIFLTAIFPVSYFVAFSDEVNIFTGREEIWREFYEKLFETGQQVLVGMYPFTYHRGSEVLGYHNSYNSILGQYGIIGLILVCLFILYNVWSIILKKDFVVARYSFLIAFFGILLQSVMEDTLNAGFWIPLTFSLLGFAGQQTLEDEEYEYDDYYDYQEYYDVINEQTRSRSSRHK
ncbi:EpaQ family protein [Candidatus Enterococcus ferrettii]|uniref:Uncharacterized protein n=1 Tax=Candidatus Enterococcus ferrettii TaxID=2815324 RepID=A0ABV0EZI3_9ENTE|nr:EpaQ family protein [Enterococcus sp. 665A]MBO1342765.1 EpaQ family protein [Enterococcus sp. 665A]